MNQRGCLGADYMRSGYFVIRRQNFYHSVNFIIRQSFSQSGNRKYRNFVILSLQHLFCFSNPCYFRISVYYGRNFLFAKVNRNTFQNKIHYSYRLMHGTVSQLHFSVYIAYGKNVFNVCLKIFIYFQKFAVIIKFYTFCLRQNSFSSRCTKYHIKILSLSVRESHRMFFYIFCFAGGVVFYFVFLK